MKKWTGGLLIVGLAFILVLSYSFIGKPKSPKKQSAYEFFNAHPLHEGNSDADDELSLAKKKRLQVVQKKPQLIHLQGLSDLYSLSENVTDQESNALLVWRQMRFLFPRSDALPETAQGIKEALSICKDLLPMIEKDKALRFGDINANEGCPHFVKESNNEIDIPCGLVEDSSITLIGIPDSEKDSFQIELIGQRVNEELNPPIVLQYKVFLPGENFTKEPFTIQNSWTKESGWGKEERCPDHRMSGVLRVDGLVKCNIQIGQRTAGESTNTSRPTHSKFANVSGRAVSASTALHFVEGNIFTASLWVGSEGFHMTVNGRHETAFAYRDKLEPWLVNRVNVNGGLTIMSLLAKGLPVTEDVDLADVQNLKALSLSNKRLALLIGVFSAGNNFERRMAIRRTWMKYDSIRSGDVAVRFFIGLHANKDMNFKLWKEAQAYNDIQLMPFVDYYSLLTYKTIAICILGTKILSAKFIMKTDDDAFVRVNEVLSSLKGKPSDGLLYGSISFDSEPHRDKDNKWYISDQEWPHSRYPPWAHGPGYIISQDIAKFIVHGHMKRELVLFKLEDVGVGIWIEHFEKHGHRIEYVNDDRFHNAGCESDYILAHYQNPRMMLCLWEKLRKDQKPECCED